VVARLYATYKQAAEWVQKNPDEAAGIITPKATAEDKKALASLIRANERLGMNLASAATLRKEIEAVYRAGIDTGYFPKQPSAETIYDKPLE
jgi:ABC-type nitrate/sulfonate/bicarbonate transport system substrate-binding protein